jgi:hypothetical protein
VNILTGRAGDPGRTGTTRGFELIGRDYRAGLFYVARVLSSIFPLVSFSFLSLTRPTRSTGMDHATAASSPSVSRDGSLEPTAPVHTMEDTTVDPVVSGGNASASDEESEDTPEARALAQGLCVPFVLFFHLHSPKSIALIVEFYFADTNLPFDKSALIHYQKPNRINGTQTDLCGRFTLLPMSTGSLSPPSLHLSVCVTWNPLAPTGSPPYCAQVPSSK